MIPYEMKIILKENNKYVIRFDKEEEVIEGLKNFCKAENIGAGCFSAIGAAKEIILSYFNVEQKVYRDKTVIKDLEIAAFSGNVSELGGEIVIHGHGVFADSKFNVKAGHVKKIVVSATCEVVLEKLAGKIQRARDENTGLNLIK